jgi:hypothetical protein
MLSTDLRAVNALMDMRLNEAQQQAESRNLRQRAGRAEQGWLYEQRCWLLCQVGQLLTSLGQRFEQFELPESFPIES